MKESKIKAAGGCIIAKDTHRILLQQRTMNGTYPRNWGFFGGKVENSENISQTLLREITEELDISVKEDVIMIPYEKFKDFNNLEPFFAEFVTVG